MTATILFACAESPPPGPLWSDPTSPFGEYSPAPTGDPAPDPAAAPPIQPAPSTPASQEPEANGPPACPMEVEDNGSIAKANEFTSCVRGESAWADEDYFRITAPASAIKMLVAHKEQNGRVQYRVTEEGAPIVGGLDVKFTEGSPDIDVTGGKAYIFQVSYLNTGGAPSRSYEMTVTFF